jgi:endonuclease/exonuclease/phosphatase family metal-dependent hydrolase
VLVAGVLAAGGCADDGSEEGDGGGDRDAQAEPASVRLLSQNLLHGITCAPDSDGCDLPARVRLFARQLDEGGCPQLVSIQEANQRTVELLGETLPATCDGTYEIVADADEGLDREVVLTSLPVLGQQRIRLAGPLRTALWVRVAADVGAVDFVSTHLASGADDRPCDATTCPPPCTTDESVNTCQARQVVAFAEAVAAPDSVVVIGGDLNAEPGDATLAVLTDAGYVDTHLAAGNAECDAATGDQCTSGRADEDLSDLTDPSSRQSVRIDYLLVGGDRGCEATDPTGLFNAEPADPPEEGTGGSLVFPSDHTGVEATVACPTTDQQRDEAASATVTSAATTTTAAAEAPDDETLGAITESFRTLFDGDVTDVEAKLAALEDGELLRPFFLASFEAQAAIAPRIRVRIDDVGLVGPDRAEVTYSLLLDGAPVLDHLPGEAVLVNGRWLVSRRTYCDVSTQGATEIPPPCQ